MGHVVSHDDDLVDCRRLAFLNGPRQIDVAAAVFRSAPGFPRGDDRVDVAVVGVNRPNVFGGGLPGGSVERHGCSGALREQRVGATEGVVPRQFLAAIAPVPVYSQVADLVDVAFLDRDVQSGLARPGIRDQGIGRHPEIDHAVLGVEPWQPVAQVAIEFVFVVVTRAVPPEPLGPGCHMSNDFLVGEVLIARDDHLADRHPFTLMDLEDDVDALWRGHDLASGDTGGVVPLLGIQ